MRRQHRRCRRLKENLGEITKQKKTGLSLCAPFFFFFLPSPLHSGRRHRHHRRSLTDVICFFHLVAERRGSTAATLLRLHLLQNTHLGFLAFFGSFVFWGRVVEWWGRRGGGVASSSLLEIITSSSQFCWLLLVVARQLVVGGSIKPAAESHSSFCHVNY